MELTEEECIRYQKRLKHLVKSLSIDLTITYGFVSKIGTPASLKM
jgi:hypothetical protein